jgi:hypothetical protein
MRLMTVCFSLLDKQCVSLAQTCSGSDSTLSIVTMVDNETTQATQAKDNAILCLPLTWLSRKIHVAHWKIVLFYSLSIYRR